MPRSQREPKAPAPKKKRPLLEYFAQQGFSNEPIRLTLVPGYIAPTTPEQYVQVEVVLLDLERDLEVYDERLEMILDKVEQGIVLSSDEEWDLSHLPNKIESQKELIRIMEEQEAVLGAKITQKEFKAALLAKIDEMRPLVKAGALSPMQKEVWYDLLTIRDEENSAWAGK